MVPLPVLNTTDVRPTALRQDPAYVEYYMFWAKLILLELMPYFTILALNAVIVAKIFDSKRFRMRAAAKQSMDRITAATTVTQNGLQMADTHSSSSQVNRTIKQGVFRVFCALFEYFWG